MPEQLDADLLAHLTSIANESPLVTTLSQGKPNRISSVTSEGVRLETERTGSTCSGPSPVPAWMLNDGWGQLTSSGRLVNTEFRDRPVRPVRRSSAVCALPASVPGMNVASTRPLILTYARGAVSVG
ncbi:MAG: hypothetical protein KDB04_15265 [Acidimicrobiales bacterium]|nr:hypothetical protein [Acidimicrobiales bacterium]